MPTQSVILWFKNRRARVPHKKIEKCSPCNHQSSTVNVLSDTAPRLTPLPNSSIKRSSKVCASSPSGKSARSSSTSSTILNPPSDPPSQLQTKPSLNPLPTQTILKATAHLPDSEAMAAISMTQLARITSSHKNSKNDRRTCKPRKVVAVDAIHSPPPLPVLSPPPLPPSPLLPAQIDPPPPLPPSFAVQRPLSDRTPKVIKDKNSVAYKGSTSKLEGLGNKTEKRTPASSGSKNMERTLDKGSRQENSVLLNLPTSPPPLPPEKSVKEEQSSTPCSLTLKNKEIKNSSTMKSETVRRPRVVPASPRLDQQRTYSKLDKVEVLDTSRGICRTWLSATILEHLCVNEVSAEGENQGGVSAETHENLKNANSNRLPTQATQYGTGSAAMRVANMRYLVEFEHKMDEKTKLKMKGEVKGCEMRPEAPVTNGDGAVLEWRPEVGDAVEVLRDGAWCIGVVQNFALRKGHLVSFENGDSTWVRRPSIRRYQIWRGGDRWVTKRKAPLLVVRKSIGLNAAHSPRGKRKGGDDLREREEVERVGMELMSLKRSRGGRWNERGGD